MRFIKTNSNPEHKPPPRRSRKVWGAALTMMFAAIALFSVVLLRPMSQIAEGAVLSVADRLALEGDLKMLSPRISGRTRDGEPYVIEAASALPDGPDPSRITLKGLDASVVLNDGRDANVTAKEGLFSRSEEKIELTGGVKAELSDGYVISTPNLNIGLGTKEIIAPDGVVALGPQGSLTADTLEAVDDVEQIAIFRGNVRVTFTPSAEKPADNN